MEIITPRLKMMPFDEPKHYPDMQKLYSDPETMRHIPGGVRSPAAMKQELREKLIDPWFTKGLAPFAVVDRVTGQFVGRSGLYINVDRSPNPQLGYVIGPEHRGRGIASECAQYSLHYGFDIRQFPSIDAFARQANEVSCHILNKFMFLESEFISEDGFAYCKYSISIAQWQAIKDFHRLLVTV